MSFCNISTTSLHPIILEDIKTILENQKIKWDKLRSKTVLITGATGLIGSYLVYTLIKLNDEQNFNIKILALSQNRERMEIQFSALKSREDLVLLDADITKHFDYPSKIHYIIHAASKTNPKTMVDNPVGTITINTVGTLNLLEYARKNDSVFLYLSSREIYGDTPSGKDTVDETDCGIIDHTNIRACYPESKRLSETLCIAYSHQYKVVTKIARLSHSYGPDWHFGRGRVWGEFILNEIQGKNIILKSTGQSELAFTYISDAVAGLFFILLNSDDTIYNISDKNGVVKVYELAEIVSKLHPEKKITLIFDKDNNAWYSTTKTAILDATKIENLGWKPKVSLPEGLRRTSEVFADYLKLQRESQ